MDLDIFYLIATALLSALSCSLVGSFAVVKGNAMVVDVLSHTILPGIVLSFILTGQRHDGALFLGAMTASLLTIAIIDVLEKYTTVPKDSVNAVVFPTLFALGILLAGAYAQNTDLDVECILFGDLVFLPFEKLSITESFSVPKALPSTLGVFGLCVLFVLAFYKKIVLSLFDADFASAKKLRPGLWTRGVLVLTAATCVSAFETVGAVLVIGMAVIPSATAALFVRTLSGIIWLALAFAASAVFVGYFLALFFDTSVSGMIISVLGVLYFASLLLCRTPR